MSWCNSEKLYGQGAEHDLVKRYPVNDGRDQLVTNKNFSITLEQMPITMLYKCDVLLFQRILVNSDASSSRIYSNNENT